ncbi:MAG: 4'-phosphopantetheinyl transferase superfamily protein [Anaerolineales bacterium]
MKNDNWTLPPDSLNFERQHVDIWRLSLNLLVDSVKLIESTLSVDEAERASRFHFEADKNRFVITHGVLRKILGRYLHQKPAELTFSINQYGKPASVNSNLEFNLSHSGDFALIAVTQGRKIGVDVERIRQGISAHVIAQQYFSKAEVAELQSLPIEQREAAFFICWTRKEAYIKAHGLGLALPLESFDVSLTPGQPAILRATRPESQEAARWMLRSLEVDSHYAGAIAVEGADVDFRFFSYH